MHRNLSPDMLCKYAHAYNHAASAVHGILAFIAVSNLYFVRRQGASAGVRQGNRIRHAYLAAVLQQEVAFFDTDTSSGKLLNGLNEDTLAIQSAISEKVGNFVHHLCTFLVGIAIGRAAYCWASCIPQYSRPMAVRLDTATVVALQILYITVCRCPCLLGEAQQFLCLMASCDPAASW